MDFDNNRFNGDFSFLSSLPSTDQNPFQNNDSSLLANEELFGCTAFDNPFNNEPSSFMIPTPPNRIPTEGPSNDPCFGVSNTCIDQLESFFSNDLMKNLTGDGSRINNLMPTASFAGSQILDQSHQNFQLAPLTNHQNQNFSPISFPDNGSEAGWLTDGLSCNAAGEKTALIEKMNENTDDKVVKTEKRIKRSKKENIIKGQWSPDEDSLLVQLVAHYGTKRWSVIAKTLNGRVGKQCRERWHNHLRPDIKKNEWSLEEDKMLIQAHKQIGNRWAEIAKWIPGRSENTIKNHWNATKRRQANGRKGKQLNGVGSLLQQYIKSVTGLEKSNEVSSAGGSMVESNELDELTMDTEDEVRKEAHYLDLILGRPPDNY